MKILFVYSDKNCACTKKACFELAKGLKKYSDNMIIHYTQLEENHIIEHDVIIFQRIGANAVIISKEEEKKMFGLIDKFKNIRVFIYLIDDAVLEDQEELPKRMSAHCNAVICSTNKMKQILFEYNKNVYVMRTFADMEEIESVQKTDFYGFNILWASTGGLGLDIVPSIIANTLKELDVRFICIGGGARYIDKGEKIIRYPIIPFEKFVSYLKGCQLLINPMSLIEKSIRVVEERSKKSVKEFLDCKSEIKYVLAGAAKTAIMSSKTESYQYAVRSNENGVLVDDTVSDWVEAIKKVYYDQGFREKIAANAYNDVIQHYSLDYAARRAIQICNMCIKKNS
ncbi:glycosyltransferase [Petroclostridium sp. X23]|uniref:glycosyltransferase n=1 Tax=Petroclostridium sp. X23 TaxID=3045146 RepID=UPI0024ADFC1A|nr:glycosyltransferase [Petroclostridium sp. X23]WHH58338.1 glycosyltransferase [Petroclostridium sp. X23]